MQTFLNIQTRINSFHLQITQSKGKKVSDLFQESNEITSKLNALKIISSKIQEALDSGSTENIKERFAQLKEKVEHFKKSVTHTTNEALIEDSHVKACQELKEDVQKIYAQIFPPTSPFSQAQQETDLPMLQHTNMQDRNRALSVHGNYPKTTAVFLHLITSILQGHYGPGLKNELQSFSIAILNPINLLRMTIFHYCDSGEISRSKLDCLPVTDETTELLQKISEFISKNSYQKLTIINLCLNENEIKEEENQHFFSCLNQLIQLTPIRQSYSGLNFFLRKKLEANIALGDRITLSICEGTHELAIEHIYTLIDQQRNEELIQCLGSIIFESGQLCQLLNKINNLHSTIRSSILQLSVIKHLDNNQLELAAELAKQIFNIKEYTIAYDAIAQFVLKNPLDEALQLSEKIKKDSIKFYVLTQLAKLYMKSDPHIAMEILSRIPEGYSSELKEEIIINNLQYNLDFAIESALLLILEDKYSSSEVVKKITRHLLRYMNGWDLAIQWLKQVSELSTPRVGSTQYDIIQILIDSIYPTAQYWFEVLEAINLCKDYHKNFLHSALMSKYQVNPKQLNEIILQIQDEESILTFIKCHFLNNLEESKNLEMIHQSIKNTHLSETIEIILTAVLPSNLTAVKQPLIKSLKTEKSQSKLLDQVAEKVIKVAPDMAITLLEKIQDEKVLENRLVEILKDALYLDSYQPDETAQKLIDDLIEKIQPLKSDQILPFMIAALPQHQKIAASILIKLKSSTQQNEVLHTLSKKWVDTYIFNENQLPSLTKLGIMMAWKLDTKSLINELFINSLKKRYG